MSTLQFAETHNMIVFLEKPAETKAKTINGERQLQVLVDKKKVVITETSIRSDLHLEDAGGTNCLPTRRKQRKETEVPQDETHHGDSVSIPSIDPLLSVVEKTCRLFGRIDQGLGSTSGIRAFALRNFDLEVMEFESAHSNTTAKLPILKLAQTAQENGTSVTKISVPITAEEKTNKKNGVKARSLLLMALPNEHQLTFSQYNDAKTMFDAIETRFGGSRRFLPPEWNTHVVVWMNKAEIKIMSIDDLYNNFKIVGKSVKKSVGASSGAQNLAFMTAPSTSSTNDVNTAKPAYENPNGSNLLQQDLEQIHEDDLEAMDLKWQLSLLSIREKRYFQRTGKKIFINANDIAGYDKFKVECFNYHKMGHFARECKAPRNKEGQFINQDNTRKQGNNEDTSSKAMLAIDGVGFDWSDMAEEQVQTNMALMAFPYSEVYNDKTCSKTCLTNYETLKKQCDDLIVKLNQTEFTAATYKRGLATVEEQLITYRKNEVLFGEEVAVLKREVACKDYEINVLKSEFEKVKKEKEGGIQNQLRDHMSFSSLVVDVDGGDVVVRWIFVGLKCDERIVIVTSKGIDQGLGSTSGIRAFALRNFDLEVMEFESAHTQENGTLDTKIQYNDAKTMFAAIETRFGGNKATKKTQKTLLKQQYENFSASSIESLDSIFNRLQKIMNKAEIETMSIDDLYNNFKIVEQSVKKSVGASSGAQTLAFMTAPSTNSTNDVNTAKPAYEVSTVSPNVNTASPQVSTASFSDNAVYAFLWQLSLLSMRAKRVFQLSQDGDIFRGSVDTGANKEQKRSDMAEEQVQTNMALMAFSDSEEEQLVTYRKNEVLFSEEVAVLKREVACKDYEISVLKTEFEKVKQEKEGIEFKIEKFDNASKSLDKLLGSQITDRSKKGLGYNVVPPPHPLIYNRPTKLDLSYSGLDEFKDPEFKSYGSKDSKLESNIVCDKKSDDSKENSDDSFGEKNTYQKTQGKPLMDDKGFVDSGCSRHMTGNISYLSDFKELYGVAAGTITNGSAGSQTELNAGTSTQKEEISQDCIVMPIWKDASYFDSPSKVVGNVEPKSATNDQKQVEDGPDNENDEKDKSEDDSSPKEVNVAGQHVNTASPKVNTGSFKLNTIDPSVSTASSNDQDNPKDMFKMGASHTLEATHVEFFSDEDEPEVDLGNILNSYTVPTTSNTRIHKDHPITNVIRDVKSSIQTRRMTKPTSEQGFLSDVYEQKTHDTLNTYLNACFLSQIEPRSIDKALFDSSWVEAMQEELLQFKLQQVWILVDLPHGKKAIGTKWVFRNKKDERGIMIRNCNTPIFTI
ncbi:retrovirus-related pol polyprotein from transposon TNT 1-94 [Tanacetum coccineum]